MVWLNEFAASTTESDRHWETTTPAERNRARWTRAKLSRLAMEATKQADNQPQWMSPTRSHAVENWSRMR